MFDVGFWELSVIGIVALVIVGPERLPGLARTVGLWVGKGRRMISDVKRDIDRELKASEAAELNALKTDIENAGKEVTKVADSIKEQSGIKDVENSFKDTFKDVKPVSESLKKELGDIEESAKEISEEAREASQAVAKQETDAQAQAVAEADHSTTPPTSSDKAG